MEFRGGLNRTGDESNRVNKGLSALGKDGGFSSGLSICTECRMVSPGSSVLVTNEVEI